MERISIDQHIDHPTAPFLGGTFKDMFIPFKTQLNHEQYFAGLARQNVDFHQALGELIDNSLSARRRNEVGHEQPVIVEITVRELDGSKVRLGVADSGRGIPVADLTESVFNPGGQGSERGLMNEHGFGLKNALALLTGGNRNPFVVLTRDTVLSGDLWYKIQGPYGVDMTVIDGTREEWEQDLFYLRAASIGTKVMVDVDTSYLKTLYGRLAGFELLMARLGEHIGVMHRNFINAGNIIYLRYKSLDGEWVNKQVPGIEVPIEGSANVQEIAFELDGQIYKATYKRGLLDYTAKDADAENTLGWPYPLKIYYQGSNARCGVDIVVRDRVIQTAQFETIWPEIGKSVDFNRFVGEIRLDARFRTTNNKTAMDPHSKNWEALLFKLREEFKPQATTRSHSEESLRDQLVTILRGTFTGSRVTANKTVWDGGCEIDIHVDSTDPKQVRIYELKVVDSRVLDLYQLLMAWDGLVEDGQTPTVGILVAKRHGANVKKAADALNARQDAKGNAYRFELKTVEELVPSLEPRTRGSR